MSSSRVSRSGRLLLFFLVAAGMIWGPGPARALPVSRVVGYLPEWTAQKKTWDLSLLSDLMIFSGSLSAKAELSVTGGWSRTILDEAHGRGVRVFLSVRCFAPDVIHAALLPGAGQDALLAAMVEQALIKQPGDGVELDFEGMNAADRAGLVAFVKRLRGLLRAKNPTASVALALPAVDWSSAYDVAQLAAEADLLFIMGYGFHYGGSTVAGPVAPLDGGTRWGRYHLRSTVETYKRLAGPLAKERVVLGLPLYGYDWPTAGPDIGAKTQGDGAAMFYAAARAAAKTAGRKWDADSSTPWYAYQKAGAWHQVWYEDEESLGAKMDLAIGGGLAGVGLWALGYEDASFWDAARERFAPLPPTRPPGLPPLPPMPMPPHDEPPAQSPDSCSCEVPATGCAISPRGASGSTALWPVGLLLLGLLGRRRYASTMKLTTVVALPPMLSVAARRAPGTCASPALPLT